jgi:uncharacterized protein YktB (UPF0637 family)
MKLKKIFFSETTEPISTKLCSKMGNQIYFKIAGKKKIERRVEPPDTFLEENHPMTIS